MAYLVEPNNLLFILNPRTASTAISSHLGSSLPGGRWIPDSDQLKADGSISIQRKHSTINELLDAKLLSSEQISTLSTFSVVRNPYDSLVTLWTKKRFAYAELVNSKEFFGNKIPSFNADMEFIQNHTFSEWIIENFIPKYDSSKRNSIHKKYVDGVDYVLRYESLQEEFDSLMRQLGIQVDPIPILNKTKKKKTDWRSYYSPEAVEAVKNCFEYDLVEFNYRFK